MGISICAIIIEIDTENLDFTSVLNNLFDGNFLSTDEPCDCRRDDCFFIAKTNEYLIVSNSKIIDEVLQSDDSVTIERVQKYFASRFIFVFEEYDSGGTYGYAIIRDNKIVRKFRSITYEVTVDVGELDETESKWRNLPTKYVDDDNCGHEKVYYHPDSETDVYNEESLPPIILHELMEGKLGFDADSMYDHIIHSEFFKLKKGDLTCKKWWQIWK